MSDEFKDAGRYFEESEFAALPIAIPETDWTFEGWFIWLGGDGPLIEADNGQWEIGRNQGGKCSYRIGGEERKTSLDVSDMQEAWIYLALVKLGPTATLYFNDAVVDRWGDVLEDAVLSSCTAMKRAVGFAAHLAVYKDSLGADVLLQHWELGKNRV